MIASTSFEEESLHGGLFLFNVAKVISRMKRRNTHEENDIFDKGCAIFFIFLMVKYLRQQYFTVRDFRLPKKITVKFEYKMPVGLVVESL